MSSNSRLHNKTKVNYKTKAKLITNYSINTYYIIIIKLNFDIEKTAQNVLSNNFVVTTLFINFHTS